MILLDDIISTLIYVTISFVLFLVGKFAYQLFNKNTKVAYELVENDNLAFSFAYVGYFIGLILAIGSAVLGPSHGLVADLISIGSFGLLAIVLLNMSKTLNDRLIFSRFKIGKEILEDKNVGTGIVEGANAIATGLIILGAVYGESHGSAGPLTTAIIYWIGGQIILIGTTYTYNLITPYDIHDHIVKGNVAVAVGYAGAIIAIANLIRNALMHDFVSWVTTAEDVAFNLGFGLIFLPIARFLTDRILLPGQKLTDEIVNQEHPNTGAALVEAFAYIGGSMMITWAL